MPTITLTLSTAAAQRVSAALTETKGLAAPASAADVKDHIIEDLKSMVRNSERRIALAAAVPGTEPTIT